MRHFSLTPHTMFVPLHCTHTDLDGHGLYSRQRFARLSVQHWPRLLQGPNEGALLSTHDLVHIPLLVLQRRQPSTQYLWYTAPGCTYI